MPTPHIYPTFSEALKHEPEPDDREQSADDYNVPPGKNLVEFTEYRDETSPTGTRRFALYFVSITDSSKSIWHSLFQNSKGSQIKSVKHTVPLMAQLANITINPVNSMDDAIPALEKLLHQEFCITTKRSTRNGVVRADITGFLLDKKPKTATTTSASFFDDPIGDLFEGRKTETKTKAKTDEPSPETKTPSEFIEPTWQNFFRHMYDFHREINRLRNKHLKASAANATASLEAITKTLKTMLEDALNAQ